MCVAEPPAKLTWYLPNGDPLLHNGDNIVFDTSEKNRASLMLKNVSRDMSGMFRCGVELPTNIRETILIINLDPPCVRCVAKNSSGEDEHEVRVDILAPPARPSGPVQVYKVARQTNIF